MNGQVGREHQRAREGAEAQHGHAGREALEGDPIVDRPAQPVVHGRRAEQHEARDRAAERREVQPPLGRPDPREPLAEGHDDQERRQHLRPLRQDAQLLEQVRERLGVVALALRRLGGHGAGAHCAFTQAVLARPVDGVAQPTQSDAHTSIDVERGGQVMQRTTPRPSRLFPAACGVGEGDRRASAKPRRASSRRGARRAAIDPRPPGTYPRARGLAVPTVEATRRVHQ